MLKQAKFNVYLAKFNEILQMLNFQRSYLLSMKFVSFGNILLLTKFCYYEKVIFDFFSNHRITFFL